MSDRPIPCPVCAGRIERCHACLVTRPSERQRQLAEAADEYCTDMQTDEVWANNFGHGAALSLPADEPDNSTEAVAARRAMFTSFGWPT